MVQAYILIQTEVGKARDVAAAIAEVAGVVRVDAVTGPYEVITLAEAHTQGSPKRIPLRLFFHALCNRDGGRCAPDETLLPNARIANATVDFSPPFPSVNSVAIATPENPNRAIRLRLIDLARFLKTSQQV